MSMVKATILLDEVEDSRLVAAYDQGYQAGCADHRAKSVAIQLLEDKIADLETRNFDLVKHNNELLARARKAEDLIKSFGNSGSFQ